ncbi:MAG: hypothetical protein AB7G80_07560 [Dongiaceae bacterium]
MIEKASASAPAREFAEIEILSKEPLEGKNRLAVRIKFSYYHGFLVLTGSILAGKLDSLRKIGKHFRGATSPKRLKTADFRFLAAASLVERSKFVDEAGVAQWADLTYLRQFPVYDLTEEGEKGASNPLRYRLLAADSLLPGFAAVEVDFECIHPRQPNRSQQATFLVKAKNLKPLASLPTNYSQAEATLKKAGALLHSFNDKPAWQSVAVTSSSEGYYFNGALYRAKGPAYIMNYRNGIQRREYYQDIGAPGSRHRTDGPAVEEAMGGRIIETEYWWMGESLSKVEWEAKAVAESKNPLAVIDPRNIAAAKQKRRAL